MWDAGNRRKVPPGAPTGPVVAFKVLCVLSFSVSSQRHSVSGAAAGHGGEVGLGASGAGNSGGSQWHQSPSCLQAEGTGAARTHSQSQ